MRFPSPYHSRALLPLLLSFSAASAQANIYQATNTNSSGTGSLRQAILNANANSGADTVTFASGVLGGISLDSGEIPISGDVTIMGPGAPLMQLNAMGASRHFNISSGKVSISGLALTGGKLTGATGTTGSEGSRGVAGGTGGKGEDVNGGSIYNSGDLTLSNVTLAENSISAGQGGQGGRAWNPGFDGTAKPACGDGGLGGTARGGAIYNTGTLTLDKTTLSDNNATGGQGGIGGLGLNPIVATSAGKGGQGGNAYGGAIYNGGTLIVNSVTYEGNEAIPGAAGYGSPFGATPGPQNGKPGTSSGNDAYATPTPTVHDITVTGFQGQALDAQLIAAGDQITYSIVSGTLPAGLKLSAATGKISGTPTSTATNLKVTYKVSSGTKSSNIATITFNIAAHDPQSLVVDSLSDATNNTDGLNTLREAVAYANTLTGNNTVTFKKGLSGSIVFSGTAIVIDHNVTIQGPQTAAITVDGNQRDRVFNISGGTVTLSNLTITHGNQSGILNASNLTLANCTLADNTSAGGGAGIYNQPTATLTVINCTFSKNRDAGGNGGGIYNSGILTVNSSTLANNSSSFRGGGIYNEGTLTLNNSLLAGNSAIAGLDLYGVSSAGDYNLVQNPGATVLAGTHNLKGLDPKLGPLTSNGGPAPTMALLPGSPALDAGATDLLADQRGQKRPFGTADDIGAFESQVKPLPSVSIDDISVTEGNAGTRNATFTIKLSAAQTNSVKVSYATSITAENPATGGVDYMGRRGSVSFAAGETSKTITVIVYSDKVYETDEQFQIKLSEPVKTLIGKGTGVCTIINDDSAPVISVKNASANEGNPGDATPETLNFEVTLSNPSSRTVKVKVSTVSAATNPATSGVDYTPLLSTISFAAGETSKIVSVTIKGDSMVEGNESFGLQLSQPTGGTLSSAAVDGILTVIGTILDDDAAVKGATTKSVQSGSANSS